MFANQIHQQVVVSYQLIHDYSTPRNSDNKLKRSYSNKGNIY